MLGASKFLATATMTGVANTQKMSAGHRWEDRDAGRVGARTATRGVANSQKMYAGGKGGLGGRRAGRVHVRQADAGRHAGRPACVYL